jgi:hypothetical protein
MTPLSAFQPWPADQARSCRKAWRQGASYTTPWETIPAFVGELTDEEVSTPPREGYAPPNDSKDAVITPDAKHLYRLGSFESYSINRYDLAADGQATYKGQYTLKATKAAVGNPGVFDLSGIVQYDLP